MAKTVIRIGIIQRSRPPRRRTSMAMPAWIAPVFIVMPMNPPITRMNKATSMAPNMLTAVEHVDVAGGGVLDAVHPVDRRHERIDDDPRRARLDLLVRAGFGEPVSGSRAYWPAGMIHVAIAMRTMRAKRIV